MWQEGTLKEGEPAAAKRGKGDEPKSVGDLVKQRATEASTEALKRASKDENAKPEVREAAKKELANRGENEKSSEKSGANKGDRNDEQNDDTEVEQIDSEIVEKYNLNKKQAESYMKLSQDEDASGLASIADGVGYSLVDRDADLKDLLNQGYGEDSKIYQKTFLEKFADKMSAHNDAISSAVEKYGLKTFKAFMKENSETISDKELNHIINQALESKENESWIDKKGNEKINHPKIKKMNEMFMKMTYGDGLSDDEYKEFKDLQEELYNQKMNNKNWRKNHNID